MRRTKEAFRWIVGILRKHKVPFMVFGGLAAELYGSRRPLADIDIDVPETGFQRIMSEVGDYLVSGPGIYKDRNWRLMLMTLKYKGQVIDIAGKEHTRIFDHTRKMWLPLHSHFSHVKWKYSSGLRVPVMLESELIAYKKEIWRRVDRADVRAMERRNRR
ncbi:MAG: hypothetical protein HY367_03815 [Candidatus Aenigmarchaeota archaeon]|nr:hypothetical protein [Candidatus Aenigmarchaeota archaeon]